MIFRERTNDIDFVMLMLWILIIWNDKGNFLSFSNFLFCTFIDEKVNNSVFEGMILAAFILDGWFKQIINKSNLLHKNGQ